MQWPNIAGSHLQKCRYDRSPCRQPRAPMTCWCCSRSAGPGATSPPPRSSASTTPPSRAASPRWSSRSAAACWRAVGGGWELTDLGREALSAAEAVESAVCGRWPPTTGGVRTLEGVVRISATDGFSAYIAAPAAAQVQRRHPEGRGRDRRRDPAGHASSAPASTSRWSSANRRCTAPRPSGSATTASGLYGSRDYLRRARHAGERRRPRRAIRWSTSSTRCCRSTTWTSRAASRPRCANRSPPPTSSCMSRPPGRPRASACCRASWPTGIATWSGCCRDDVAVQLTYWLVTRAETLRTPGGRGGGGGDQGTHA